MVDYGTTGWAHGFPRDLRVLGTQRVTVTGTPAALAIPTGTTIVVIEYTGASRIRWDGATPSSSDPERLDRDVDQCLASLAVGWRAVRSGPTDAAVFVTYLGL